MDWDQFIAHFSREWEPGKHVAIIAPTGQGKTTVLVSLLNDAGRKFAWAFDPKGGDSTLASLGWPRMAEGPYRAPWWKFWEIDDYDRMADGEPVRCLVGPIARTNEDLLRLRATYERLLKRAYDEGGWTVAVDEFQIMSDKRIMGLGTEVEVLLIAARDKGVSVVTLFQRPANVSRAAVDQCEWLFIGLTRDKDVVDRLSEILGRSYNEVLGMIQGLASRDFSWLVARNNPRKAVIVTRPPRVARKPVNV